MVIGNGHQTIIGKYTASGARTSFCSHKVVVQIRFKGSAEYGLAGMCFELYFVLSLSCMYHCSTLRGACRVGRLRFTAVAFKIGNEVSISESVG